MHSQTRLRSGCAPEHQGCAQIALLNTRTALRSHSRMPELHSDCTPNDQDCKSQNLKLHSEHHSERTRSAIVCRLRPIYLTAIRIAAVLQGASSALRALAFRTVPAAVPSSMQHQEQLHATNALREHPPFPSPHFLTIRHSCLGKPRHQCLSMLTIPRCQIIEIYSIGLSTSTNCAVLLFGGRLTNKKL